MEDFHFSVRVVVALDQWAGRGGGGARVHSVCSHPLPAASQSPPCVAGCRSAFYKQFILILLASATCD